MREQTNERAAQGHERADKRMATFHFMPFLHIVERVQEGD